MVESRNLSVMFTDIKGFTARTSKSTRDDLVALLRKHEEILRPLAEERGGSLIKNIGDSFLFTFETPTNAVLAGIAIQLALSKYNAGVVDKERIEVRVGINAGEVTEIEGDVFGDAVNIASRIESLAEPNQIFFSETVYLTMNKTETQRALDDNGLSTAEVGFRSLKGVEEDVRVYRIFGEGRSAGLRTVELSSDIGVDLALDDDNGAAPVSKSDMVLQPLAELDLAGGGQMEIERTPEIRTAPVQRPTKPRPVVLKSRKKTPERGHRILLVVVLPLLLLGLLALGAGVVLQSVWIVAAGTLVMMVASPLRLGMAFRKTTLVRFAAVLLLVLMVSVFNATPVMEIQLRVDGLTHELMSHGRDNFSIRDWAALYTLEILRLADHARRGYREAASHQLYRLLPGGRTRRFSSDIPMTSPTVMRPMLEFHRQLKVAWHRGVEEASLPPAELLLQSGADPPRLVSAMPLMRLSAKARRDDQGWGISAVAVVPVSCPPPGQAPMFEINGMTVMMEQQLCSYLEQEGWLSSYSAKWTWALRDDDPRLTAGGSP